MQEVNRAYNIWILRTSFRLRFQYMGARSGYLDTLLANNAESPDQIEFSARAYIKVLKVASTIAYPAFARHSPPRRAKA